jgi:hypothetical protein
MAANGEGVLGGWGDPLFEYDPAIDHLWMVNDLPGRPFVASDDVPPATMFTNGQDAGECSYEADSLVGVTGVLFSPADLYGDDFAFGGPFSIELFFKTDGDQSDAGRMQLVLGGEVFFRYGIIVNEGGFGNVRFAVNDGRGHIRVVDANTASSRNYADGEWHYLLATYDPEAGDTGELSLVLANEDGSFDYAVATLGSSFAGMPGGGDGNLLIGRDGSSPSGSRTFLGLIDEVQLTAAVVPSDLRLGPTVGAPIALWNMVPAPDLPDPPDGTNPVTLDARVNLDEGLEQGVSGAVKEEDHLWSFNDLPGQPYTTSDDVPPESMLANGNSGGTTSYDASAIAGVDGVLFYPQDQYGDEFSLDGPFSVELFFKTAGDQSDAGVMQLVRQGESADRFSLTVNEGEAGSVRFTIVDQAGGTESIDIRAVSSQNYADGEWHYVLATYDLRVEPRGRLILAIANEDGTADRAWVNVDAGFGGLATGNDGNLLIGRHTYRELQEPRTFLGLIDAVQISRGVTPVADRVGLLPATADPDGDGVVTLDDYAVFADCLNGPVTGPSPALPTLPDDCLAAFDVDADGDVDTADFAGFQRAFDN